MGPTLCHGLFDHLQVFGIGSLGARLVSIVADWLLKNNTKAAAVKLEIIHKNIFFGTPKATCIL